MASSPDHHWSHLALVRLGAYSFGVTGLVFALDTVILPTRVLEIAPENLKNTYLGVLGVSGLGLAALVHLAIGRISDRTRSPLGRRVGTRSYRREELCGFHYSDSTECF